MSGRFRGSVTALKGRQSGASMTAQSDVVAGRYRLLDEVGSGAMGVVWRAHDDRLNRVVALKELRLQQGLTDREAADAKARALREGRIAGRLQHPNAISVFDVFTDPDRSGDNPWLVMEYLPSRSLSAVLSEYGPIAPPEVARIGHRLAEALTAAHRAGIVHRDVKPGNVLLGEDGTVKITDFGIARATWDVVITRTGLVAGTPAYFAPEVARGAPTTFASDVFSLGATLYAAVEGVPPFGADTGNALALLRSVGEGHFAPPRQAGALTAVLMRLLVADPDLRPGMTEVARELAAVVARSEAAGTVPSTFPARGTLPLTPTLLNEVPAANPSTSARPTSDQPASAGSPSDQPASAASTSAQPTSAQRTSAQRTSAQPTSAQPTSAQPGSARPASAEPTSARPSSAGSASAASRDVPGKRHPGGRRPSLVAAALLLLVALGVGAWFLMDDGPGSSDPDDVAAPSSSAPPVPPRDPEPADGATDGSAEPGTTPNGGTEAGINSTDIATRVRTYYELLPADPARAWTFLGEPEQAKAGGYEGYVSFWNGIRSVDIEGAPEVNGDTVSLTLRFVTSDGSVSVERYRLQMGADPEGRPLIRSASTG